MTTRPLEGIRVLDLGRYIAAPYCAMMLAAFGADVLRVEKIGGEPGRYSGPYIRGRSFYYPSFNQGKRNIAVDLRSDEGLQIVRSLARTADALVENFRPGTLSAIGLDYDTMRSHNPGLVVASVNGFGSDGRLKDRTAFDSIAQAMSGLMDVTRGADDKPLVSGAFLADIAAGNHAAMGVVMALFERTRTGMGQSLEVSLLDSAISYLGLAVPAAGAGLETLARRGSRDPLRSPATVFPALDGFVFIHAGVEPVWIRLAIAIGRKDLLEDERFRGYQARLANVAELESEISAWTSGRSQADIVSALSAADIPCGPVNTVAQAIGDEDVLGRGAVRRYEFDGFGSMPLPGFPIRMGGTWTPIAAPRGCGADTIEILAGELGMAQDEIADLLDRGIVALPPASDIQGHQDAVDQA